MSYAKGPWTTKRWLDKNTQPVYRINIPNGMDNHLADVYSPFFSEELQMREEDQKACANLMAAAPEMYELLRVLEFEGSPHKRHLEMIRTVLAKAEGK